jgi:hypothetical protein
MINCFDFLIKIDDIKRNNGINYLKIKIIIYKNKKYFKYFKIYYK